MNIIKLIRKWLSRCPQEPIFEIKEGSHTRFITLNELRQEQKEKAFINQHSQYTSGRSGTSNRLTRVHSRIHTFQEHERKNQ